MSDTPTSGRRASRANAEPLPRLYFALVVAVSLAGLLLRLRSFGNSLAGDEISTFYIVNGHSLARVLDLVFSRQETTPPLFFVLAWITKGWLGSPAESIRLVSFVTGVASIPMTFVLGLWTVGRRAAVVGAVCIAFSPYMIYFSTEARTYMLVLFLGLVSSLCLLRALDTNRSLWWVGYAVATCGAFYSHYSSAFFLVAQLAWAFWAAPRARKALIIANAAAVVGFLPWINGLRADLKAPNFITLLIPVNVHNVTGILENFWIGHPIILVSTLPGNAALTLALLGLALGALGLALIGWNAWKEGRLLRRPPPRVLMIVTLAIAPAALMIIYSWLRVDVLGGGNMIASWPAMGLTVGALVMAPPRPLRVVAVSLTVVAYAIGGFRMLSSTSQRGNVGAAVAFIDRTGRYGDPIVSAPFFANPLSEVDAALAYTSSVTYVPGNTMDHVRPLTRSDPHPVIRLSTPPLQSPPLEEQFRHLTSPDPEPVFFNLPAPPPQKVAQQAMSLAHNGTVFLITPYPVFTNYWLKKKPDSQLSQFLKAMDSRFHIVEQVTYPSDVADESVTVFRETQPPKR